MKKVLFFAIIGTFVFTSVKAQQAKVLDPMAFNPGIFNPVPIGSYARGVAYIKEAPQTTGTYPIPMVAYIQMIGPNGQIVEVPIGGEMYNIPGDWEGAFIRDRQTGLPVKYPKIIPVTVRAKFALTTDGRQLLDAKGQPLGVMDIIF